MRHLIMGLFGVLTTTAAMAADIPLKAPPSIATTYTWSGFYLGGHFGWGFERHTSTNVGTINSANFPAGTSNSADIDGALGGLQAGYDWQFDPHWLVGLAGSFSLADVGGDATDPSPVVPAVVNHPHTDYRWLSTATARVGFVTDAWLFYVKGGGAWAREETNSFTTNAAGAVVTTTEGSLTRTGWTVGTGTEYRLAQNWSALVEYDYVDFGTATVSSVVTRGTIAPVLTGVSLLRDNTAAIHEIKVGINYRF